MTNKEILAQLKKAYNSLYDIRENGCEDHCNGQLRGFSIEQLEIAMDNMANIYSTLRESLPDNEVMVTLKGLEYGNYQGTYYIGHSISEDYSELYDEKTDETFYLTCSDIGYTWYEDNEFLIKNLESEVCL